MEQVKTCGIQYRIWVEGHVGKEWVDWPGNTQIVHYFDPDKTLATTLFIVELPDPPALYGLLDKLRDLNLRLVSLQRAEA